MLQLKGCLLYSSHLQIRDAGSGLNEWTCKSHVVVILLYKLIGLHTNEVRRKLTWFVLLSPLESLMPVEQAMIFLVLGLFFFCNDNINKFSNDACFKNFV